ncbi:N-6 DNA methylase [Clostridium sp. LBM24168]
MKKINLILELREIHKILFEFYRKTSDCKYGNDFCDRAAYSLLNKILFVRICEDKGFMKNMEVNTVINSTLAELIEVAFNCKEGYFGNIILYSEEEYEFLNPVYGDPCFDYFNDICNDIMGRLNSDRFNFKNTDENILGDVYQEFMDKNSRKAAGQFYTPGFIIEYMLKKTVGEADVLENPFVSLADISCGSGHFLIRAYDILKKKFLDNLENLRERYGKKIYVIRGNRSEKRLQGSQYWVEKNVHYHILKYCIYGADIDSFAVQLTRINLLLKDSDNFTDELNIVQCDSLVRWETVKKRILPLFDFWNTRFDYVVGNPPYVGHKQLDIKYKKWLLNNYGEVFKDKSDLSFCFFCRIREVLNIKGKAAVITSRYFMESPTGKNLRQYLKNKSIIFEIVDFYGAEIFEGAGVAASIYIFGNDRSKNSKENKIQVNKLLKDTFVFDDQADLENTMKTDLFESFHISQHILGDERWILIPENQYDIYRKIIDGTSYRLRDIADSFQGVITGCDRAFVVSNEDIARNKIEEELIKKWIKNSNIKKYRVLNSDLNLIYSDLIENEQDYSNSLKFIENYVHKLKNRRECRKGVRKWYQLQWGRDHRLFEQKKIVFSYKGKNNKFALDSDNSYCSADVYSLVLKNEFKNKASLEYLTGVLNSSIYEFYFKLFAKKMGKGIYDYYPNSVMDLRVTLNSNIEKSVSEKVEQILKNFSFMKDVNIDEILKEDNLATGYFKIKFNNIRLKKRIYFLEKEIDKVLGDFFCLNDEDFDTIKKVLDLPESEGEVFLSEQESIYYKYIHMNGGYRKADLGELMNILLIYIRQKSIKILKENKRPISLWDIKERFEEELFGFEKIIDVFKITDIKTSSEEVIKKSLNNDSYTWNAYMKDKEKHKIRKTFVKYNNYYYGLSEWEITDAR